MKVKELIELNGCFAQMEIWNKTTKVGILIDKDDKFKDLYKDTLEKEIEYIDCDYHSLLIVVEEVAPAYNLLAAGELYIK